VRHTARRPVHDIDEHRTMPESKIDISRSLELCFANSFAGFAACFIPNGSPSLVKWAKLEKLCFRIGRARPMLAIYDRRKAIVLLDQCTYAGIYIVRIVRPK
jgi:hypothetical protein